MGTFNTLIVNMACPVCKVQVTMPIQFKYGDSWQKDYSLGEKLTWGGNDIGVANAEYVVLDGAGENCPNCDAETDFYIFLRNDVFEKVIPADGSIDFVARNDSFIVLEE